MRRGRIAIGALLMLASVAGAAPADDVAVLTKQLEAFLGSSSSAEAHDRFWADDLIYTGSGGRRVGKADILRDVRAAPPPKPEDPKTTFTAEDVRIHTYGTMAVVAFRLIGTTTRRDSTTRVARFLNSGTFRKSAGQWRAVSWQATRMPRSESDARREVVAAEASLQEALGRADVARIMSLTDSTFVWAPHDGDRMSRARVIDQLGSGKLRYASPGTDSVSVTVRGDAAVVLRGASTSTFYNQDGEWKALSLQTSRP